VTSSAEPHTRRRPRWEVPSNRRNHRSAASRRSVCTFLDSFGISRIASQGSANLQRSPPSLNANGTEAIMLSAMSLNVRRYNAVDKAALSLCPREHSGTLDCMARQKRSQARCRRVWPDCGPAEAAHSGIPRFPDRRPEGTRAARAQRSTDDDSSEQISPRRRRTYHVAAKGGG